MKDFLALGEASKPLTSCSKYETLIRVNWSPGSKIHGPSAHCPVEYRLQILSAVRISTKKIKNTPKKIIRKKGTPRLTEKQKKEKNAHPSVLRGEIAETVFFIQFLDEIGDLVEVAITQPLNGLLLPVRERGIEVHHIRRS